MALRKARLRLGVLALCLSAFAAADAPVAQAWCQYCTVQTQSACGDQECCAQPCLCEERGGETVAWPTRCVSWAFTDASTPSYLDSEEVRAAARTAFDAWTTLGCADGNLTATEESIPSEVTIPEFVPDGGNANAIAFLEEWSVPGIELDPSVLAITTVVFRVADATIIDADIALNAERNRWSFCDGGNCAGASNLQNVLTHEVGHFLGLEHTDQDEPEDAVMWMCEDGSATRDPLIELDDEDGMCTIYDIEALACAPDPFGGYDPEPAATRSGCGCGVDPRGETSGGLFLFFILIGWALRRRHS